VTATLTPYTPKVSISYELGWNGVPLFGTHDNPVAFDTETSIDNDIDPSAINRLALIQVSDGTRTVLVHPLDCARFVEAHRDVPFVGHNWTYDFWVVHEYLVKHGFTAAAEHWWEKADQGLFHCTMILDALVRLAEGKGETGELEENLPMRGLGDLSREFAGIVLNKMDPYRKRYVEIIGKKFSEVIDKGFWEYAAKDAYATARVWPPLLRKAKALAHRFTEGLGTTPGCGPVDRLKRWAQYGPLTEQIQLKGAIALAQVERTGMPFGPAAVRTEESKWRPRLDEYVLELDALRPMFFKKKGKRFELTKKARTPSVIKGDLIQALSDAALKIQEKLPDFQIPQSSGKNFEKTGDAVSLAADDWSAYRMFDPFIGKWLDFSDTVKRLSFFSVFQPPARTLFTDLEPAVEPRIRSRIDLLKRTGRVSYRNPNLQQMPRDPMFRGVFEVAPGKKLFTVDYSFIELRTLAAICYDMFGYSVLGDVIKAGRDPHAYTAALINNIDFEDFLALKKTDPARYKKDRQSAKALNFGIPGGLGAKKLVSYAAQTYGVHLTAAESEAFREKIINQVYPELNPRDGYLADPTYQALALNTGLSRGEILTALPGTPEMRTFLGRILARMAKGATTKADGSPYNARFFEECWDFLEGLGRKAPMAGPLAEATRKKLLARQGDFLVDRELTQAHAVTITGRIRSKVRYTVAKNCVDYETEALTKRGWVKGPDLTLADEILTKNAETGALEWQKPTDIKLFPDHEGPMMEFRSNTFSAVTTPDHRWLVTDRKAGKDVCKTSASLSKWGDDSIHRTGTYAAPMTSKWGKEFVELCGWFLTDGSMRIYRWKDGTTITPSAQVFQSERANPAKLARMKACVTALDAVAHSHKDKAECVSFRLNPDVSWELHRLFPDRVLTSEFLLTLTAEELTLLRETMIAGDGSRDKKGRAKFVCRDEDRRDAFQFLCLLSGKATRSVWRDMSMYKPKVSAKMLNSPKMNGVWMVNVLERPTVQVTKKQTRKFHGKVPIWCPMIPNTYFIARRDGCVYCTGNTPFQGLAADGAKLALYALTRRGYKVCAFVHDEVIIELDEATAESESKLVEKILCDEMASVLTGGVPVEVEGHVGTSWSK